MHEMISFNQVLLGACLAGFTIYLGLPIALLSVRQSTRVFFNALSVGILLFLFVEIVYQVVERIESLLKLNVVGLAETGELIQFLVLFIGGFSFALIGLIWFENKFIKHSPDMNDASPNSIKLDPKKISIMIAIGIGLHNFSEGLVIGQSFASGSVGLGFLLIAGFALHNATEGFGIAAPLTGQKFRIPLLIFLGLIGGGPTVIGAYLGTFFVSAMVEVLFLSLAAGAILYIVGELIHLGRLKGKHQTMAAGLLVGFFLAFASDLLIERAMVDSLEKHASKNVIEMEAGEYFFKPDHIEVKAGEVVKLLVTNVGEGEHEIEIFGKGVMMEEVLPVGTTVV